MHRGGFTDFGYALGLRYALTEHHHEQEEEGNYGRHGVPAGEPTAESHWKPAAIGLELFGGLGNINAFGGPFDVQPHYLSPLLMFHPREHVMVHIGAAFGLTGVSDDLIRT